MSETKEERYGNIMLENQLCFPLYACSKEIIRKYKPYLDRPRPRTSWLPSGQGAIPDRR